MNAGNEHDRFGRHKRIDEACFVGDPSMAKEDIDLAVRFWLLLGLRETCRFHVQKSQQNVAKKVSAGMSDSMIVDSNSPLDLKRN